MTRKSQVADSRRRTPPLQTEEWRLAELQADLADLDQGKTVSHDRVVKWLKSWGQRVEDRPPWEQVRHVSPGTVVR